MKKQYLKKFAFGLGVGIFSAIAQAFPVIQVSQESAAGVGDFGSNILGEIGAFETDLTASEYYQYGKPKKFSFNNNDFELVSNRSHVFFVNGADGLSLFTVQDRKFDKRGGFVNMTYALEGDAVDIKVKDDPSDKYTMFDSQTLNVKQKWHRKRTDGLVLGGLEDDWAMTIDFNNWSKNSILDWFAYSSDNEAIELSLEKNRRIHLTIANISTPIEQVAEVPEPATIGMLAIGSAAGLIRRRRKV